MKGHKPGENLMCHPNQRVEMPLLAIDYRINWNMRIYPCEIDSCLAPLIYKMNQKQGIVTNTSCCGHFGRNKGLIGIESHSIYNAIKAGYQVQSGHGIWERKDGAEHEEEWYYIEFPLKN